MSTLHGLLKRPVCIFKITQRLCLITGLYYSYLQIEGLGSEDYRMFIYDDGPISVHSLTLSHTHLIVMTTWNEIPRARPSMDTGGLVI